MSNVTIAVPVELKARMDQYEDVNWSAVARQAIEQKLEKLELLQKMDRMLANSKLTEEDAILLGREVKARMAARYRARDKREARR